MRNSNMIFSKRNCGKEGLYVCYNFDPLNNVCRSTNNERTLLFAKSDWLVESTIIFPSTKEEKRKNNVIYNFET
jgi:hypothetical protein